MVSLEDVFEAMSEAGCPVCQLSSNRVERFLDRLIYEQVNDPGIRQALRDSQGLCSAHAWQLAGMPNSPGLGLALVYRDVVQDVRLSVEASYGDTTSSSSFIGRSLAGLARTTGHLFHLAPPTDSHAACPACSYAAQVEGSALRALVAGLAQDGERVTHHLAESDGLCLRHLQQALALDSRPSVSHLLADDARHRLQALDQELAAYIQHQDYRFRDREPGSWASAWRRALSFVSGERDAP